MSGVFISQLVFEVMSPFEDTPTSAGVVTARFDAGEGSDWYIVGAVTDSGEELLSKTIKSIRVTGKVTDASMMIFGYGVKTTVSVDDLEDGANSSTGAILVPDSTRVVQSARLNVNVPNSVLWTVRVEGSDVGQSTRDRVDEIVVEVAESGVRR